MGKEIVASSAVALVKSMRAVVGTATSPCTTHVPRAADTRSRSVDLGSLNENQVSPPLKTCHQPSSGGNPIESNDSEEVAKVNVPCDLVAMLGPWYVRVSGYCLVS